MTAEYEPVRMTLAGVEPGVQLGQALPQAGRKLVTRYDTIILKSANANGPQPVLPENPRRVIAELVPHTPNASDAHTSAGWIGPKGVVISQQGTFIVAGGQGPTNIRGSDAVWCATDPGSSTDLWLSVTDTCAEDG